MAPGEEHRGDCSVRILYRQEAEALTGMRGLLGMTAAEAELVQRSCLGAGLWQISSSQRRLVNHRLLDSELPMVDGIGPSAPSRDSAYCDDDG